MTIDLRAIPATFGVPTISTAAWLLLFTLVALFAPACGGDGSSPGSAVDAEADPGDGADTADAADASDGAGGADATADAPTDPATDASPDGDASADATPDGGDDTGGDDTGGTDADADDDVDPDIVEDTDVGPPITELTTVPGPADALASEHLPVIWMADPEDDDFVFNDTIALGIREVLVATAEDATVRSMNDLLARHGATITGALPGGRILLLRFDTDSFEALSAIIDALADESALELALPEHGVEEERLGAYAADPGRWEWDVPAYPSGPGDHGNWGLEMVRAPQLWNLDTLVRRDPASTRISAAVIDAGFTDVAAGRAASTHPDFRRADGTVVLQIVQTGSRAVPVHEHGTFIAGVIGATWDDGVGVEGINPWLAAIQGRSQAFRWWSHTTWGRQLNNITRLVVNDPTVRAINNSYGLSGTYRRADFFHGDWRAEDGSFLPETFAYGEFDSNARYEFVYDDVNGSGGADDGEWKFAEFGVDIDGDRRYDRGFDVDRDGRRDSWADVVRFYARMYELQLDAAMVGRDDFFVVASSGNAGPHYTSVYNSPINNVADRVGGRFLSVESTNWNNAISTFSSRGGSVAAPGECVRSVEASNGSNYDSAACASGPGWADGSDALHATSSGTSFAAPAVTGLVAALWHLDPSLTVTQLRGLVVGDGTTAATGGTHRIDAFAAAIGIDGVNGDSNIQRALVDVDDGTTDGNARMIIGSGGTPEVSRTVDTDDDRRGDGEVSMADFRAYRDALAEVMLEADPSLDVRLEGPVGHFKRDLNLDGCVGTLVADPPHPTEVVRAAADCANAPGEAVFPRFDFNGDGRVGHGRMAFAGSDLRDIDVLSAVWPEADDVLTEKWPADELADLLPRPDGSGGSADLVLSAPASAFDGAEEIEISIDGTPMERSLVSPDDPIVWTVPAGSGAAIEAFALRAGERIHEVCAEDGEGLPLSIGEDRVVDLEACGPDGAGHDETGVEAYNQYGPFSWRSERTTLEAGSEVELDVRCPELGEVDDECRYSRALGGEFVRGLISVTITRVADERYTLDATVQLRPAAGPLPAAPEPGCAGPLDGGRFVFCEARTTIPITIRATVHTVLESDRSMLVDCDGTAETTVTGESGGTGWADPFYEFSVAYGGTGGFLGDVSGCFASDTNSHLAPYAFEWDEVVAGESGGFDPGPRSVQLTLRLQADAYHWLHTTESAFGQAMDATVSLEVGPR